MTNSRDDWHTEDSSSGLSLFDEKASAAGSFPTSMLGYDRQSVDGYVREVEQQVIHLKVQLRERNQDLEHQRVESGITDFGRLGAHAKALLQSAEAQAAELVRQAETESERIRGEGRRAAASMRESAQREADDVRMNGLTGLRKLRQEQAQAGDAALAAARRDAELASAEAEAAAQHIIDDAALRANTTTETAAATAAAHLQEAERRAAQTILEAQQEAERSLTESLENARATEAAITEQLDRAVANHEDSAARLDAARQEAADIRAQAVASAEETRHAATREAEQTLSAMRSRLHDDETRLEEQVAWRKEQLEREIAALTARRTAMVAAMQNLREIADEATPESEDTMVITRAAEDAGDQHSN